MFKLKKYFDDNTQIEIILLSNNLPGALREYPKYINESNLDRIELINIKSGIVFHSIQVKQKNISIYDNI